jgi:hypothetical protein
MGFTGVAMRALAGTLCLGGLTACGREAAPPAPDATAGFCVGVDKAHPANDRATVTFKRLDQILGTVSNVVTGPVSLRVTPGQVTVYVDETATATSSVSAGNRVYASSGAGCPASLSP